MMIRSFAVRLAETWSLSIKTNTRYAAASRDSRFAKRHRFADKFASFSTLLRFNISFIRSGLALQKECGWFSRFASTYQDVVCTWKCSCEWWAIIDLIMIGKSCVSIASGNCVFSSVAGFFSLPLPALSALFFFRRTTWLFMYFSLGFWIYKM